ncbi:MAG: hypothetical protein WAU01_10590 [Saprospiraceae bacterium]
MKMPYNTFCLICLTSVTILLSSCKNNPKSHNKGTDLLKYGVPVVIQTPDDVVITKLGSGQLTDVSVRNDQGYDVQIFMTNAVSNDMTRLKREKKELIITNPYFSKIVEEYDEGFIYEIRNESNERSYDFNIVKISGNNEISFQCGNSKEFTESEVKKMVRSIMK